MRWLWAFGALSLVAATSKDAPTPPAGEVDWTTYGGAASEQRFSSLTQINASTLPRLGLAWSAQFDTNRGQEATPLVVNGVLYTTTAWSKVYAFDAVTGRQLWKYDPKVEGQAGFKACCDVVNRGAAYYDGKVYVGTLDGRLIALDAETGALRWSVVTVDQHKSYTITGAPRIVKGRVLIGNGGAEYGVRGYVSAYDAETGRMAWRFYTVPPGPGAPPDGAASDPVLEKERATWAGDWSKLGGGGTVWDSIVYDKAFNQVLIGVGNGSPWNYQIRSQGKGDNLFLSSVVALDADTGRYKWHYQGAPADAWDFTQTNSIILADLPIDGQVRKVMMQAPKNGYFYVIDRSDGRLLSAKGYVAQNWSSGVDMKTGRPIETPDSHYQGKPFVALPSGWGAHNWQPMAYDPQTRLAYIPTQEIPLAYGADPDFKPDSQGWNLGVDLSINALPDDVAKLAAIKASLKGYLQAWDPVTQKEAWRVPHAGPWNGGVLTTAGGLVFQGTADGHLLAVDARTGRREWDFYTGVGIVAAPMTYSIGGRQYLAVLTGLGGSEIASPFAPLTGPRPPGRIMVFALDARTAYAPPKITLAPPVQVADAWTAAQVAHGGAIFSLRCAQCHGATARSSGILPDLRRSPVLADAESWKAVTTDGVLASRGMVSFSRWYSPADLEDVRGYVAERARHLAQAGN